MERLPEPLHAIAVRFGAPGLKLHDHGPHHWKCVALTAFDIVARQPAVDLLVVYVFAQLHDSQRLNEFSDPEHGPRAADVAASAIAEGVIDGFEIDSDGAATLVLAIREHTTALRSDDLTVGACWDADRFNLWRVGIEPDLKYISTPAARENFEEISTLARQRIRASEPSWAEVEAAAPASLNLGTKTGDSRFTDNSAGTKMDIGIEAILAVQDLLGLPESEQRARVLARHAERPFGWQVFKALRAAGWLPMDAKGPYQPSDGDRSS